MSSLPDFSIVQLRSINIQQHLIHCLHLAAINEPYFSIDSLTTPNDIHHALLINTRHRSIHHGRSSITNKAPRRGSSLRPHPSKLHHHQPPAPRRLLLLVRQRNRQRLRTQPSLHQLERSLLLLPRRARLRASEHKMGRLSGTMPWSVWMR